MYERYIKRALDVVLSAVGLVVLSPLLALIALAIRLEATIDELVDTIHCHPTVAEGLREAALAADKRAVHIPNKK